MKKHFMLKLNPCRPTFAQDMTKEERDIMQQHFVYWKDLMQKEFVLVFGPVMDAKGAYGLGIIEAEEEEVKTFIANDPASKINNYEYFEMRAVTPKTINQ